MFGPINSASMKEIFCEMWTTGELSPGLLSLFQLFPYRAYIQHIRVLQEAPGLHDSCRPGLLPVPVGRIRHQNFSQNAS